MGQGGRADAARKAVQGNVREGPADEEAGARGERTVDPPSAPPAAVPGARLPAQLRGLNPAASGKTSGDWVGCR